MKNENIFKQAVDHFGVENQLLKLVEEMAELTQAIIKYRLYPDEPKHFDNLIEEYIDVNNVLEQLAHSELFNSDIAASLIESFYIKKLERLESLLKTQNETKV